MKENSWELINPQSKNLAFKVFEFNDAQDFKELKKYNYFSVVLIVEGEGTLIADISEYTFTKNNLLCFSLYQPFKIRCDGRLKGMMINFHPEFFCLHKHRNEVSCNGVLFNNIYESPVLDLTGEEAQSLLTVMSGLKTEIQRPGASQPEMLISYLKILLINATRIKVERRNSTELNLNEEPEILNNLRDAVEENFTSLHSAGDYAKLLNISTAALNRLSKTHFNKTLSDLITDRIIVEAKRQLYLTSKAVKLIAYELGFNDEFYFSRFFKKNVAISPQYFRDTVGFDKANA